MEEFEMEYLKLIENLGPNTSVSLAEIENHKTNLLTSMLSPIPQDYEQAELQIKELYTRIWTSLSLDDGMASQLVKPASKKADHNVHYCTDHEKPVAMEINDKINSMTCPECGQIKKVHNMILDEVKPKTKTERTELIAKDFDTLNDHISMIEGAPILSKNNAIDPKDQAEILASLKSRFVNPQNVTFSSIVSAIRDNKLRRCCKFSAQIYREFTGKPTIKFTDDENAFIHERYGVILQLFKKIKGTDGINNLPTCNLIINKIVLNSAFEKYRCAEIREYIVLPDQPTVTKFETGFWAKIKNLDKTFVQ